MRPRPYLIGLTGNIATGKSLVAQMLGELGAGVIDADRVAHEVMRPGGPAYGGVAEEFGAGVLRADGSVDRERLGATVFRDPAALRRLEEIVHPAVQAEVERRIAAAEEPVMVVEAIKLIEAGMHRACQELWVVTAPRRLQIERLVTSRGLSRAEASLRVDAQPPQDQKAAQAGRVLANDGNLDLLRQKVQAAWDGVQAALEASRSQSSGSAAGPIIRPVRRDDLGDAAGVAHVLNSIIAEGRYTALAGHWTPEAERAFLQQMGPRSEILVAEVAGRIVAFQVVEPFVRYTTTMDHVAHVGTYVLAQFRGRGIGRALARASFRFAREQGFEKAVVYVLADNPLGQAYYRCLGFEPRGTLTRQTKIGGVYHDEVFLEMHF